MNCGEAKRVIMAVVRQEASNAERLLLDEHVQTCASCLAERGRWALMERLRDAPTPRVSPSTRAKILAMTTSPAATTHVEGAPVRRASFRYATGFALAAAAVLAVVVGGRALLRRPSSEVLVERSGARDGGPATSNEDEQAIAATESGEVRLDGAVVRYVAGTVARASSRGRRVELVDGEVDTEVTPGRPGRFRVVTPRFTVEVIGTRFVVRRDGVRTLHGVVRVVDPSGRELAIVRAGESWQLGAAPVEVAQPPVEVAHPPIEATPRVHAHAPSRSDVASPPATASALLDDAKAALASGDATTARANIHAALHAHPSKRERAAADLLTANALLVENRADRAIDAYRRVVAHHRDQPEAETALFALAQLLSERGRAADSRAALDEYLRRYPSGHFAAEVKEKLARTPPAP